MQTLIVGIGGKCGSGKDTYGDLLMKEFIKKGYYPMKVCFADSLRVLFNIITTIPIVLTTTHEGKAKILPTIYFDESNCRDRITSCIQYVMRVKPLNETLSTLVLELLHLLYIKEENRYTIPPCTIGRYLQIIGSSFRVIVGPDVWIDRWQVDASYQIQNKRNAVLIVTDVRYPNELKRIKDLSPSNHFIFHMHGGGLDHLSGRDPLHPSENSFTCSFADICIDNNHHHGKENSDYTNHLSISDLEDCARVSVRYMLK